jgi:hypothetical protein
MLRPAGTVPGGGQRWVFAFTASFVHFLFTFDSAVVCLNYVTCVMRVVSGHPAGRGRDRQLDGR